jgi:exodeoxyribonuclease V gamma subunit
VDPALLRAAMALDEENKAPESMLGGPLAPAESVSGVDLESLIRVLECPVAALLRDRLQIRLWNEKTTLLDREALELDTLAGWISRDQLLRELRKGEEPETVYELQQARSILSPGTLGAVDFEDNMAELAPVIEAAEAFAQDKAERIRIDLEISGLRITGSIGSVHGDTCLRIQVGTIKAKHQLDTWIRQLLLSAAQPERAFHSVMLSPKGQVQLETLGDTAEDRSREAQNHLSKLVEIFRSSASEPIQIFPEAGLSYAAQRAKGGDAQAAMKSARKKWTADMKDLFMTHAYGPNALLDDVEQKGDFQELSETVFGPLIRAGGKPS